MDLANKLSQSGVSDIVLIVFISLRSVDHKASRVTALRLFWVLQLGIHQ